MDKASPTITWGKRGCKQMQQMFKLSEVRQVQQILQVRQAPLQLQASLSICIDSFKDSHTIKWGIMEEFSKSIENATGHGRLLEVLR